MSHTPQERGNMHRDETTDRLAQALACIKSAQTTVLSIDNAALTEQHLVIVQSIRSLLRVSRQLTEAIYVERQAQS